MTNKTIIAALIAISAFASAAHAGDRNWDDIINSEPTFFPAPKNEGKGHHNWDEWDDMIKKAIVSPFAVDADGKLQTSTNCDAKTNLCHYSLTLGKRGERVVQFMAYKDINDQLVDAYVCKINANVNIMECEDYKTGEIENAVKVDGRWEKSASPKATINDYKPTTQRRGR